MKKQTTILIVDDEPRFLRLIEANLRTAGYNVIQAEDGEKACTYFAKHPNSIDLILLDVMMPVMNGFSACREIRKISTVPIMFLTARGEEQDRIKGLELGADDYLVKPFSATELLARAKAVLRRKDRTNEEIVQDKISTLEYIVNTLRKNNEDLEKKIMGLNKTKGGTADLEQYKFFMASVAHSIKGELGHIKFLADSLFELTQNQPSAQEDHEMIVRSCDYSFLLMQKLMDFLDMGSSQLEIVDLRDVFARLEPLSRQRLPSKGINLYFIIEQMKHPPLIVGNSMQITSVLKELIDNAIAELREKGGDIDVILKQNQNKTIITIKDTGQGIPKKIRAKIFKEQLSSSKGSGWGLYLCYKIIKSINGNLTLTSPSKKGTAITISFKTQAEKERNEQNSDSR